MAINIEITPSPDTHALAAIHAASFEKGWDAPSIAQMLAVGGTMAFVAGAGKGFALLRVVADEAEILTLAVLPAYRKQGFGKALVGMMCKWVAEEKAQAIFLEVRQSNEAALQLYRKMGFAILSLRKDYYRNADGTTEHAALLRYTLRYTP